MFEIMWKVLDVSGVDMVMVVVCCVNFSDKSKELFLDYID